MAESLAPAPAQPVAAPIKTPQPGAAKPSAEPDPKSDPASVTLGAGAAPAATEPAAESRARDAAGRFVALDGSVDLQDKLWGEGGEPVAPEDRAEFDLDGNPVQAIKLRVQRPYKGAPAGEGVGEPAADGTPASVTLGAESPAGGEPAAVAAAGELVPAVPAPGAELDLSDPANADALIQLVIEGSPTVYKNRQHLVQAVKSLRGMYNVAERARLQQVAANHQNYSSAGAWERVARAHGYVDGQAPPVPAAAGATPQGRSPAPGTAGPDATGRQAAAAVSDATGAPEESIAAAVDWDLYNEIKRAKGPEVAQLWATARMIHQATSKTSERIEEMQRPSREATQEFNLGHEYGKTMQQMSDWANDDGSLSYPEFTDDAALEEIGRALVAFKQQGVSPEFLKTPRGMHTVILSWRDWRAAKGNPWRAPASQPAVAPPSDAANLTPNADIETAVASVARTITGRSAPTRPATSHDARDQRVRESILTADRNPHGDEFPWAP